MMFRQALLAAVVAASFGGFAAPAVAAPVVVAINVGPPAMRFEAVPAPRRSYEWHPGYWNWRHNRHVWVAGTWVRVRPGYVYVQPPWVDRGGRWELQHGAWSRGDRDGNGVRNGRDRAPDNPRRN